MVDNGRWLVDELDAVVGEPVGELAVLSAGERECLVETAAGDEQLARHREVVRREERASLA